MSKETAAVKFAWKDLHEATITMAQAPTEFDRCYVQLKRTIERLPDADASDTALRWSTELPTVEGWYWVAFAGAPLIYWIEQREGRLRATIDHFNWTDVADFATGNYQFMTIQQPQGE